MYSCLSHRSHDEYSRRDNPANSLTRKIASLICMRKEYASRTCRSREKVVNAAPASTYLRVVPDEIEMDATQDFGTVVDVLQCELDGGYHSAADGAFRNLVAHGKEAGGVERGAFRIAAPDHRR